MKSMKNNQQSCKNTKNQWKYMSLWKNYQKSMTLSIYEKLWKFVKIYENVEKCEIKAGSTFYRLKGRFPSPYDETYL